MDEDGPKVEFALGSRVSDGHFFKSSFARSFVTNCRDAKSLDFEYFDNSAVAEQSTGNCFNDSRNNNFFSLTNFGNTIDNGNSSGPKSSTWQTFNEPNPSNEDNGEMDKLRKQCQDLKDENRRLAESLQANQVPRVQVIDNVFLQTQIDTLQWQLKQTESNRQMYRSLMGQVVRFLERAQKSLDKIHEKTNPKGKTARVPRSRSVHVVDHEAVGSTVRLDGNVVKSPSNCSNSVSSRFARAKSVAQIAPQSSGCTSFREFTWSVLRRNDASNSTPPRVKNPVIAHHELNQTHEGVVYRRPKQQVEVDPDSVPPEKLSQEAFRLMRTVQSLLAMREPNLVMVSLNEDRMSSSTFRQDRMSFAATENELTSLQSNNFANSTILNDTISYNGRCSSSDRGSTGSGAESERMSFVKSSSSVRDSSMSSSSTLRSMLPGSRMSIDVSSFKSNRPNVKTTADDDDEDCRANSTASSASIVSGDTRDVFVTRNACPTSTPNRRAGKKFEKKHETSRSSRIKPKPANSASSAEDESGFSSMSSFQEVGLPLPFASPISPIKGCHTEIGLPEIPMDKVRHRRWSSTPVEIQAVFKRHSAHFANPSSKSESLSVWV